LPEIEVTLPLPDILKRHVPNVYFSKFTSRKDEAPVLTDDSNIEYRNIFPSILSKNKKIAINVSLERMPERHNDWGAQSPSPSYDP
jgi:hypothetical protein